MAGCWFGAALGVLVLMIALRRRHHHFHFAHAYGDAHCGGGHHHGHDYGPGHGFGFGKRMRRGLARRIFMKLDTTPGQEKAILKAVETLRENMRSERDELRISRKEMAQSMGGDTFDRAILDTAFARQTAVFDRARKELTIALETVHGALDSDQRATLAELLSEGGWFGGLRGFGRF